MVRGVSSSPSAAIKRTPSTPPPPPIRRSSSISSNGGKDLASAGRNSDYADEEEEDEDATPHGSVENIAEDARSMRKSLQMMAEQATQAAESLRNLNGGGGGHGSSQRELPSGLVLMKRTVSGPDSSNNNINSNYLSNRSSVSFAPTATVMSDNGGAYSRVGTHHVIPVKGGAETISSRTIPVNISSSPYSDQPSPEGEIYGFGRKFKEGSRNYFDSAGAAPKSSQLVMSQEEMQNRLFLDSLSKRLTASIPETSSPSVSSASSSNASTLRKSADYREAAPAWHHHQTGNY